MVQGAASILSEVLYNLVDNAIGYSDKGPIEISVAKEGENALVVVKDNGMGIPEEEQERIFERFYRIDKSHSKASGGTGLGLAIVKRGVLYHGGNVKVQSAPGKGSAFIVSIPMG